MKVETKKSITTVDELLDNLNEIKDLINAEMDILEDEMIDYDRDDEEEVELMLESDHSQGRLKIKLENLNEKFLERVIEIRDNFIDYVIKIGNGVYLDPEEKAIYDLIDDDKVYGELNDLQQEVYRYYACSEAIDEDVDKEAILEEIREIYEDCYLKIDLNEVMMI